MIKLEEFFASLADWSIKFGIKLLAAVMIILIGWWITKLVCRFLKKVLFKSKLDDGASGFIVSIVKTAMLIVFAIAGVGQIISLTSLVAALGAAGLTASFALQGSLSNFVSGMQVIFSKPFSIGDFLSVEGIDGTVSKIDVLNTTLLSIDNKEIIIPNSKMTSGIVINYTSQKSRRLDLSYSVSYNTDLKLPKQILSELIENDERIYKSPEPIVAVGKHLDSSIEIVAKFWVNTEDYWGIYFEMQEKVKNEFDKSGVTIPFPQLDVHNMQ